MLSAKLSRLHVPMLYVNRRGLENNGKTCYTFDGMTAAYGKDGRLLAEAAPFEEARSTFHFERSAGTLVPASPMPPWQETCSFSPCATASENFSPPSAYPKS